MLIGLHGKKSAGKDTVYERASRILADVVPVERVAFADLMYQSAAEALGVTVAELQEWKNRDVRVRVFSVHGVHSELTVRRYLQRYGTEAHRGTFGPDFWVDNVDLTDHADRVVFVTDVRFENEARAIKAAGGTVIRVVGPALIERNGDGHESELELPAELVDITLTNAQRDDNYRALDKLVDTALKILLRAEALDELTRMSQDLPGGYR